MEEEISLGTSKSFALNHSSLSHFSEAGAWPSFCPCVSGLDGPGPEERGVLGIHVVPSLGMMGYRLLAPHCLVITQWVLLTHLPPMRRAALIIAWVPLGGSSPTPSKAFDLRLSPGPSS